MTCNGIAGGIHGRNETAGGFDWGASSLKNQNIIEDKPDEQIKAHQSPGFHVPGDGKSIMP